MELSEKITINLGVVDLGQIDLLVQEGFYSSRTDLIRTAIRKELATHTDVVKQATIRRMALIGVVYLDRRSLETKRDAGERIDISVVGLLVIEDDVTPELAASVINSVRVSGSIKAKPEVRRSIQDRIR